MTVKHAALHKLPNKHTQKANYVNRINTFYYVNTKIILKFPLILLLFFLFANLKRKKILSK